MGIVTPEPMPTYPDGFPPDVVDAFEEATGRGVIGNVPASGTEIIQRLGDEHVRDGQVDPLHVGRLRASRSPRTRTSCRSTSSTRACRSRAGN